MKILSSSINAGRSRFALGKLVATPNALQHVTPEDSIAALRRHMSGDWGDVSDEDKAANDIALIEETRLLSAYCTQGGVRFWVLTEADRSATTILLPEDY